MKSGALIEGGQDFFEETDKEHSGRLRKDEDLLRIQRNKDCKKILKIKVWIQRSWDGL